MYIYIYGPGVFPTPCTFSGRSSCTGMVVFWCCLSLWLWLWRCQRGTKRNNNGNKMHTTWTISLSIVRTTTKPSHLYPLQSLGVKMNVHVLTDGTPYSVFGGLLPKTLGGCGLKIEDWRFPRTIRPNLQSKCLSESRGQDECACADRWHAYG